jgi:hypothetical protein
VAPCRRGGRAARPSGRVDRAGAAGYRGRVRAGALRSGSASCFADWAIWLEKSKTTKGWSPTVQASWPDSAVAAGGAASGEAAGQPRCQPGQCAEHASDSACLAVTPWRRAWSPVAMAVSSGRRSPRSLLAGQDEPASIPQQSRIVGIARADLTGVAGVHRRRWRIQGLAVWPPGSIPNRWRRSASWPRPAPCSDLPSSGIASRSPGLGGPPPNRWPIA